MKNLSEFTGKYSISKTLRFELIPQGKTLEHIAKNQFLETDAQRKIDYQKIKKIIDKYHQAIISESLQDLTLTGLSEFESLYFKSEKTPADLKSFETLQNSMRKQLVAAFGKNERFKRIFQKDLIQQDLPVWLESIEEKNLVSKFNQFTTYFTGYHKVRKNIYSADAKASSVGFRLIHENLPKFLDNIQVFRKKILAYDELDFLKSESELKVVLKGYTIEELFTIEFFNKTLTQKGIDIYNSVLGGYTTESGKKIQGINELINLFRQKHGLKSKDIPNLKPLFKQILTDRESASFLPDQFLDDQDLFSSVSSFISEVLLLRKEESLPVLLKKSLEKLMDADLTKVYFKAGNNLSNLSQQLFKNWSICSNALDLYYETTINPPAKKRTLKYEADKAKWLKSPFFSVDQLQSALDAYLVNVDDLKPKALTSFFAELLVDESCMLEKLSISSLDLLPLLKEGALSQDPKMRKDEIAKVKVFLDAVMVLTHFVKPLYATETKSVKDFAFYGEFEPLVDQLNLVIPLYNKTRSYLTKKPYSMEKFKLNFDKSTLLNGWDSNVEKANLCVLFVKDGMYYLAIMDRKHNQVFESIPESQKDENKYQKVVYKLLPGPNKLLPKVFFSDRRISYFAPSEKIVANYEKGNHTKGEHFDQKHCHELIDFFKSSINRHEDWKNFDFQFSDTSTYDDISGFYREVENQGYKISFRDVPDSYIDQLVEEGKIYLFQLYNKDFSPYSKGKPNLHTIYWKALFDPQNLQDIVYKLNGQAEIFYREKSITYSDEQLQRGHHAEELKDKFTYPIVKDKRFAFDKFQFHVPITLNFKSNGSPRINLDVLQYLRNNPDIHIIGLDRGERHLLYLTLLDRQGKIKAQYSLNEIIATYQGKDYKKDYHGLLDEKEKGRDQARKNWDTIETIKELKEGYLSQVIHQLATMIVSKNAIVVLEDLNAGFMRGRQKVEKQVYQKFEKMLIDKLNYLVLKEKTATEAGGFLKALQLSNKFESFSAIGKQSGFLFYVPAALTSKIDPSTGFVNFLSLKYESVERSKEILRQFTSIHFNPQKEWMEIDLDFAAIKGARVPENTRSKWRIIATPHMRYRRNKSLNQGKGGQEPVSVNMELQDLLGKYGIPYGAGGNLLTEILNQSDREFFTKLFSSLSCLLSIRHNNGLKGADEKDFILSPVQNPTGEFFYSENATSEMPQNADANGAYHIAMKGKWVLDQLDKANPDELKNVKLAISNQEWLQYMQAKSVEV